MTSSGRRLEGKRMQRVFHVPSHLSYVSKLVGDTFVPVPSPMGAPLRVSDLLGLESWDFFDVLHLHTVELAASGDLAALAARLREAGKGFVFTLHDLVPNIEIDRAAFSEKTRLAVCEASRLVTLTHAAAQQVNARFGVEPSVIPRHGGRRATGTWWRSVATGHVVLLVFGALRPKPGSARAYSRVAAAIRRSAAATGTAPIPRNVGPATLLRRAGRACGGRARRA